MNTRTERSSIESITETSDLDARTEDDSRSQLDVRSSNDEEALSEYDKQLADSFPASDPPTQP